MCFLNKSSSVCGLSIHQNNHTARHKGLGQAGPVLPFTIVPSLWPCSRKHPKCSQTLERLSQHEGLQAPDGGALTGRGCRRGSWHLHEGGQWPRGCQAREEPLPPPTSGSERPALAGLGAPCLHNFSPTDQDKTKERRPNYFDQERNKGHCYQPYRITIIQ